MKKNLGIYIHIPFCIKKCDYCDFLSFPIGKMDDYEEKKNRYIEALLREMEESREFLSEYEADTVFLGGGTPSVLSGADIERILCKLKTVVKVADDAEISMEVNPGTADEAKLKGYRKAGVNRLSIGLQSADPAELKLLGRIHTYEQFEETYALARQSGFMNINVDLMLALPGQGQETYRRTVEKVLALNPEHISAYSLIVEEGTPFYSRYGEGEGQDMLPDEESDRDMYADTLRLLQKKGYHRYEISNYAKEGYECRHNLKYWQADEYIGFGLGSASYFQGKRAKNTSDFTCCLDDTKRKEEREVLHLSKEEQMEEFMFLGLRTIKGVSKEEFLKRFGVRMEEIYAPVLRRYEQLQMLINEEFVSLTEKGLDVSNVIMADFLL